MSSFYLPWLELLPVLPLLGAGWAYVTPDGDRSHRRSTLASALTLAVATAAALDYVRIAASHDVRLVQGALFAVDELSAPLLPLVALVYAVTILATPKEKTDRFAFSGTLASESILLATLTTRGPVALAVLLCAGLVPPRFELRARGGRARPYTLHAAAFVALLATGMALSSGGAGTETWGMPLIALAMLLRSGVPPLHAWTLDLIRRGSFGTTILLISPMAGAYGMMRLCIPIAPEWLLRAIILVCSFGSLWAAGTALTVNDSRRVFVALASGQAALVLIGLALGNPIGVAGGLCLWISAALSLAGLGLVLRAVESRIGRFTLARFLGLYTQVPTLAALFLLTGLALVGFPGTIGFVGSELLIEGSAVLHPAEGLVVVSTAALNGVAILRAYLRTFTGTSRSARPVLAIRNRERIAVLLLAGLVIGGGVLPQPGVSSRYRAAEHLLRSRSAAISSPRPTGGPRRDLLGRWALREGQLLVTAPRSIAASGLDPGGRAGTLAGHGCSSPRNKPRSRSSDRSLPRRSSSRPSRSASSGSTRRITPRRRSSPWPPPAS